jgi:protein-S-isoprenylcysteine O-methyltransferase Ste14
MELQSVQRIRKRVLAGGLLIYFGLAAVSHSSALLPADLHEVLEGFGLFCMAVAVLGRGWSALYIGGRKKTTLVRSGPYSIMRNPLYSFTFIGVFGAGLEFGGMTLAVFGLVLSWLVFWLVVQQEERFLLESYGASYRRYMGEVPRFLPRFSEWQDEAKLEVRPALVVRTVLEASLLLLAWPLFELVEWLQGDGLLPVLFSLY